MRICTFFISKHSILAVAELAKAWEVVLSLKGACTHSYIAHPPNRAEGDQLVMAPVITKAPKFAATEEISSLAS